MSTADPLEQVRIIFREEGQDLIQKLDDGLAQLDRVTPAEWAPFVGELMRSTHNLKGVAGSIGFEATGRIAHAMEELLRAEKAWNAKALDTLHRAVDALRDSLQSPQLGDQTAPLIQELNQLAQSSGAQTRPLKSAAPEAPEAPVAAADTNEFARLPLTQLSDMMVKSGDLALRLKQVDQRVSALREMSQQLATLAQRPTALSGELTLLERQLSTMVRQISLDALRDRLLAESTYDALSHLRLQPLSVVLKGIPRTARELARSLGKEVHVSVSAGFVRVEKSTTQLLQNALVHLVRNSIDHGLEAPDERQRAGKAPAGALTVSARIEGNCLVAELSDDGRGVDPDKVRAAAVRAKVLSESEAAALSPQAAQALIFRPGLSTKTEVTDISGRGVGLDAVLAEVHRQGGSVHLESELGKGTTFVLQIPLLSHRTHVLILSAAGQTLAVPSASVWQVTRFDLAQACEVAGQPALELSGTRMPIVSLAGLLGFPAPPLRHGSSLVVLRSQGLAVACAIDELLLDEDVLSRECDSLVTLPSMLAGAAVRGNGQVVCVLNAVELVRLAAGSTVRVATRAAPARTPLRVAHRVLVVDDSFTVRTLEKSIFELAGYEVLLATNGEEALALLRKERVSVVVSDINMPRMDGFELLAAVRRDASLRPLPFVLVTSRGLETDRQRGVDLGVSAYIIKSEFDQELLLEAVARLCAND